MLNLFKKESNRTTAINLIGKGIQEECYSMSGANYVVGLCKMARELDLITQHEYSEFTGIAWDRAQKAEKKKREEAKALAEQRKAERAAKAKAAKEVEK